MASQFNSRLSDETSTYGIINISVANLRRQAVFQSELVNQIILGTVVPVFEEQNGFLYVENWDGMSGWLSQASVVVVDRQKAESWLNAPRATYMGKSGIVTQNPGADKKALAELVLLSTVKIIQEEGEFNLIELPDGRRGYIGRQDLIAEEIQLAVHSTIDNLITASNRFLGMPYHWGGTSSKAFDCSGFIQTLCRLVNVALPRDAGEMAEKGEEIDSGQWSEGDLLFFGKTRKRITHVALYVGDQQYIHADGFVRINSLSPESPAYNKDRHESLLFAKRIL